MNLGQIGEQGIGHAVGKILLLRIGRQILQRNYCDRGSVYGGMGVATTTTPATRYSRGDESSTPRSICLGIAGSSGARPGRETAPAPGRVVKTAR